MITEIKDNVVYIDVDETLILPAGEDLFIPTEPNTPLIDQIKQWKSKGKQVIVWTSNGNGVQHAINTVRILGIEEWVDLCLPKPHTIVDDDHLEYYNTIDPKTLEYR